MDRYQTWGHTAVIRRRGLGTLRGGHALTMDRSNRSRAAGAWAGLSSVRFAVILIGLWALAGVLALAFPGGVGAYALAPYSVAVLGGLLALSLLACTVERARRRRRAALSASARPGSAAAVPVPLPPGISEEGALGRAGGVLSGLRYSVRPGEGGSLRAERYRVSRHSMTIVHLALIALIGFVAAAALTGFEEPFVSVVEGEEFAVGHGTELMVSLESFEVDYWEDGTPKTYLSTVTFREESGEEHPGTVAVNHPFGANGVRVFQAGFGRAPLLVLEDDEGAPTEVAVPLEGLFGREPARPIGTSAVAPLGLRVWVIGAAASDPSLAREQLVVELTREADGASVGRAAPRRGETVDIGGFKVRYAGDKAFSVFTVSRQPFRNGIWAASGLFVLGLVGLLWFPYSAIQVAVRKEIGTEPRLVVTALPGGRGRTPDLVRVALELRARLQEAETEEAVPGQSGPEVARGGAD